MPDWMNTLLLWTGFAFLPVMGALCIMLLIKMWTNQIDLSTILAEANGDASISRFQLLVFSLVVAVGLFLQILKNMTLPEIPNSILVLLGISASTYAAGKGISFSRPEGVTKPTAPSPAKQGIDTPPSEPKIGPNGPTDSHGSSTD